jgi:hypothetical protein
MAVFVNILHGYLYRDMKMKGFSSEPPPNPSEMDNGEWDSRITDRLKKRSLHSLGNGRCFLEKSESIKSMISVRIIDQLLMWEIMD